MYARGQCQGGQSLDEVLSSEGLAEPVHPQNPASNGGDAATASAQQTEGDGWNLHCPCGDAVLWPQQPHWF